MGSAAFLQEPEQEEREPEAMLEEELEMEQGEEESPLEMDEQRGSDVGSYGESGDEADKEEEDEECDEGEGRKLDLGVLSKEPHPCLAEGHFSVFNSPRVGPATVQDVSYNIDMDGFVVLSKCLSTFKVGRFGEARAWSGQKIQDMDKKIYKSRVFDQLPTDLSRFERWLPSFKLVESTPLSPVHVILRPKSSATAHEVAEWSKQWKNLPKVWWMSVFIPAIRSLPVDTRTRRFNTVRTFGVTGLLPTYMRLYKEDIVPLDQALNNPMHQLDDFEWFFISYGYGQRKELEEGEPLGPGAFGLSDMFDLTSITKISLHIALNFSFTDRTYSLFWDLEETYRWIQSRLFVKYKYPLFGLSELGNITASMPVHPALEVALGEEPRLTYCQFYSPTVKAMEERVPLIARPHLLTYLLGEGYVSGRTKFKGVWDEVRTQRTLYELLEVVHPAVPLDARMELVVTDNDSSFLASFGHRRLARVILKGRLLIKVPASDFSGYALNLVRELYGPLRAAVKGHLTGPGTLGTVMLCECLLSFLPTGCHLNQPYRALKAYDIVPLGRLRLTRKIDLRRFARTVNGILYVRRPVVERIWIQMSSLPASARATAAAVLSFLEKLKAGPRSKGAICTAATIIVDQFQHDLCEMGVVRDPYMFKGTSSVCIRDALTAEEYVSRVFDRPEQLPSVMSTRAFLTTALDLFPPSQLHAKITDSLLIRVKLVPQATVHARAVNFSSSFCTVIVRGPMSAAMSPDDTHRLVVAASQLIKENFVVSKNSLAQCLQFRPRLIQCVRQAIMKASSRTNGRLCHILAVVAYATMMLADRERIVPKRPNFKKLRMKTNLYRYILMDEMKEIVRTMDTEVMVNQEEVPKERRQIALRCIPECRVVVSRIAH